MKNKLTYFALAILAGSAVITQAFLFKQVIQGHSDFTRNLSPQLGAWRSIRDMPISQTEIIGLETQDIKRSVYSDGMHSIELVVAYIAHSTRKSAHAQEACLRGAGALVSHLETVKFQDPAISGKLINLQFQNQKHWVLYFYKIGPHYTADYLRSSWLMFFGGLTGQEQKGSALIRLLTPEKPGESQETIQERLRQFSALLIPELEAKLP